jgi:hypothetical protein
MRDGYLGALAARTLGVAPVLRPVTPSRFEPDGPTGRLEISEGGDVAADRHASSEIDRNPRQPAALGEPAPVAVAHEERLLPPVDPDHPAPSLMPTQSPALDERGVQNDLAALAPAANTDTAALGIATLAQAFALPATEPGPGPSQTPAAGRPGAATAHANASDHSHASQATDTTPPPPVIVRIGRIDVRAGDVSPRPAPIPRAPAAQMGRSLADHLAARDRELS